MDVYIQGIVSTTESQISQSTPTRWHDGGIYISSVSKIFVHDWFCRTYTDSVVLVSYHMKDSQ